ncbi:MAG: 2-hydroxyacyl-CoA dehydratase family protein [Firmicutes bacterium]|nr:2-hydroxyacyl-CoA dehydratase family protein [Bacillota bacterium]
MQDYQQALARSAAGDGPPAVYLLVSGNPVELIHAFGLLPVFPEIQALQRAVRHESLPLIQEAEARGYSTDNCAYVKTDIGAWYRYSRSPSPTVPPPGLLLANYVGCQVYWQWWEQLEDFSHAPLYLLDVPFSRSRDGLPTPDDIAYVVRQLRELIPILERLSGRRYDPDRLRQVLQLSRETEELWSRIKWLAARDPAPFDAYFDAATLMAPLYVLRGTAAGRDYFQTVWTELEARQKAGQGPLERENFRLVIDGPPPWPYLRAFRDMFARWGAVFVASTYSGVGGLWEFGFRHQPDDPLTTLATHMLTWNVPNQNLRQRYDLLSRYLREWHGEGLVIHAVKSCRLFSSGHGDMREYFAKTLKVPTLLIESDLADPRYFSPAQMRTRIDAFMESLISSRLGRDAIS